MKTKQTGQLLFWMGLLIIFWSVGGIGGILAAIGLTLMMYAMLTNSKQTPLKNKQLLLTFIIIIFMLLILDAVGLFGRLGDWINDMLYGG